MPLILLKLPAVSLWLLLPLHLRTGSCCAFTYLITADKNCCARSHVLAVRLDVQLRVVAALVVPVARSEYCGFLHLRYFHQVLEGLYHKNFHFTRLLRL